MTREEYIRRFDWAARFCRDFAQQMVVEQLPERIKFDVAVSGPTERDGRLKLPWGGRLVFPKQLTGMEYVTARKLFWADGRIPIWINLNVTRIEGEFTVIEVRASNTVTDDDTKLYPMEDYPPFHILGPWVPPKWKRGERFSLAWKG
jgi:hypothetical protein